ncbi:MAG: hypothetical protein Q8P35_00210 [Candidatus Yanofskybacteria bacterium]|nr:hypothetical protein [Candidatus Yanofskybacteria bacterium]
MNKYAQILLLFLIIAVVSIISPPLFGFIEGMPMVIFFLAIILYWGLEPGLIVPVIAYSLAGDIILGHPLGLSAIGFLGMFFTLLGIQRFIEIRPFTRSLVPRFGSSFLGTVIAFIAGYVSFSFIYTLASRIFYNESASLMIITWNIMAYAIGGVAFALIFLRLTEKRLKF